MSNVKQIKRKNYADIAENTKSFIMEKLRDSNAKGVVLGLSGGLDSSVVAFVCKEALDDKYPMIAVMMPDNTIPSNAVEMQDAMSVVDQLKLQHETIPIDPLVSLYQENISFKNLQNKTVTGNLRARIRSNILYNFANMFDYLVAGTSDKSELNIGYFTKYGDGACDFMPIAHLYKTEVRELARHLHVPEPIIKKKSSPHLWNEQTAEGEIGATYEEVDMILQCILEHGLRTRDNIKKQVPNIEPSKVDRVLDLYQRSEHKRHLAPCLT